MMIIIEHDQMILSENDHVFGPIVPEIFLFFWNIENKLELNISNPGLGVEQIPAPKAGSLHPPVI